MRAGAHALVGHLSRLVALVGVLAIALGGGGAMAPTTAQPKPIVVGAPIAITGNLADSAAHVKRGYDLWLEEVNGRGGLLGRPVQFRTYDDRSDATTAARLTERLIATEARPPASARGSTA